jgi:uncharacterized SAM-binding protein YcdF (DUF218 family)
MLRKAGRWIMRTMAGIGFAFVLVTVTPVDTLWIRWLAGPWNDPKGDVLIVLGSDMVQDVIGWSSYWRSVYAVRIWREGGQSAWALYSSAYAERLLDGRTFSQHSDWEPNPNP